MSSSRKKKTKKQLKNYLSILIPVLAVLLLLALILTFGKYTSAAPADTTPTDPGLQENPYDASDFEYENGYLTCITDEALLGIDVSEHQKNVDWKQVKAAGVDFVMIRVGYRGYTEGKLYMDSWFNRHFRGAREAGLDIGVYFFSQAITPAEAQKEARFLLALLTGRELEMGIAYDWEFVNDDARTGSVDGRTMTDCAIAFCDTVAAAGHTPLVYFNQYQADNYYTLEELTRYGFWLASYSDAMDFPHRVKMWQYTEEGTVPGITGNVDINLYWP